MPTSSSILPGMGNTKGLLTPLIPFNVIVETDVGLLSLIYKEYLDEDVFDPSYFEKKTVKQMVLDLYRRKDKNPLSLCIREEYKDMQDEFYAQFMEREYDKILDLSVITEMYRVVSSFNNEYEIQTTILCNRDEERDLMLSEPVTKKCDIVMYESLKLPEILRHNQFYFKSLDDTIPFAKHLKNKTIYIADYGFNVDDEGKLPQDDIVPFMSFHNDVRLIDVFNMNKLEGEN